MPRRYAMSSTMTASRTTRSPSKSSRSKCATWRASRLILVQTQPRIAKSKYVIRPTLVARDGCVPETWCRPMPNHLEVPCECGGHGSSEDSSHHRRTLTVSRVDTELQWFGNDDTDNNTDSGSGFESATFVTIAPTTPSPTQQPAQRSSTRQPSQRPLPTLDPYPMTVMGWTDMKSPGQPGRLAYWRGNSASRS